MQGVHRLPARPCGSTLQGVPRCQGQLKRFDGCGVPAHWRSDCHCSGRNTTPCQRPGRQRSNYRTDCHALQPTHWYRFSIGGLPWQPIIRGAHSSKHWSTNGGKGSRSARCAAMRAPRWYLAVCANADAILAVLPPAAMLTDTTTAALRALAAHAAVLAYAAPAALLAEAALAAMLTEAAATAVFTRAAPAAVLTDTGPATPFAGVPHASMVADASPATLLAAVASASVWASTPFQCVRKRGYSRCTGGVRGCHVVLAAALHPRHRSGNSSDSSSSDGCSPPGGSSRIRSSTGRH